MIITVMSNKGGVGKTTMATIIAEMAYEIELEKGLSTPLEKPLICALDFDRQRNLIKKLTLSQNDKEKTQSKPKKSEPTEADFLQYIDAKRASLSELVETLEEVEEYKYIVLDTPPSMEMLYIEKLEQISDVIVVPFKTEDDAFVGAKKLVTRQLTCPEQKCVAVHLTETEKRIFQIVKEWYKRFILKYRTIFEQKCRNYIEIELWADVPKNIDYQWFYKKGFKPSQRAKYNELRNMIFGC